ncbi:sulfotransferase family protein [Robiginitomaculum antarcticum]|uniref:sulfotransferase family protein n=1 Tax=Robiginitomaculum antarcticum TaxID=437507 RepID=UPI000360E609|nr:sulfotransferase family protein [Robiginitomaculum antarcticum]
MDERQKVFGIGFHKTGTKSLRKALEILDYSVCGPVGTRDPDIAKSAYDIALNYAGRFDAVQDNPFPPLFRELDAAFPGSKFILTTEEVDVWIARAVRYFNEQETPMRRWIYGVGSPVGNEETYRARFVRHNDEVRTYFASRPHDLLDWPLTKRPGWEPLCGFLECDIPDDVDFPHENKGLRS